MATNPHTRVEGSRYGIMKMAILDLRSKGWSYGRICQELGCVRSTVAYHCGVGQKEKTLTRLTKSRVRKKYERKLADNFNNIY